MNAYAALVRRLGRTRAFAGVASRLLPPIDRRFAHSRRSLASFGTGFPLCYLTTTGRRTGKRRTTPLLYVGDGDRFVVIGSNFGNRRDPAWVANLRASPAAVVSVEGVSHAVVARAATSGERDAYWRQAVRVWPGYEDYARRAGRELPIVVLEPRDG